METAVKGGVQVHGGPLGYVYARNRFELETETTALLSAKSADCHAAVMPLLRGLTVEKDFCTNVAAVSGSKTTGLGGTCGATPKLLPTHYCPCVFAFHGADGVAPSVAATNLTAACESARERFGFSAYRPPCPNAEETTGREICVALGLNPDETMLYLTVTESFREAVFLCNTFLHFGGAERVTIRGGGGDDRCRESSCPDPASSDLTETDAVPVSRLDPYGAVRIPLYPINLAMPDFNRVNAEPFNRRHRALGDNCEMPKAFYNDELCRLLHGYVLGPAAVALRVRNLDAVARGSAHMGLDETHEGVVLPNDVPFPLLESERGGVVSKGPGGVGRGGDSAVQAGGPVGAAARSRKKMGGGGGGVDSVQAGDVNGSSASSSSSSPGLERRTASVMASDATMAVESMMSASVYEDTACDPDEWPMFADASDDSDRVSALASYLSRVAGLVGAMVFASNSALYMTEVEDSGKPDGKEAPQPSFYRFYQIAAPHLAGNSLVDREGRPATSPNHRNHHSGNSVGGRSANGQDQSVATGNKTASNRGGNGSTGGYQDFQLEYLALACGFCAQILAKMLFYLERCDAGASAYRYDSDALRHAVSAMDADVPCDLCRRFEKHRCARTTIYRLRHRLPKFGGNNPIRGAMCLFGAAVNNYSDTDPLGSYAPFSALKRAEGESARTVIQDTYRVTVERLMGELDSAGLIYRDDPTDPSGTDSCVRDGKSFMEVASAIRGAVDREAAQLMHKLVYSRDFKVREGLADANHTLYLTVEPYSTGICPLLAFLHRRSLLAVLQDMALSQCSHLMHGQQVEARNFRTQFQAVLRKRVLEMQNAGFLSSRQVTVTLTDPSVMTPDLSKDQHAPPLTDVDGDLVRVNVDVIKELKVKNRVMFFGASTATSEAARARAAGMADAYQRPSRRTDVLSGALGFFLKRYHNALFPNGKPGGGGGGPNGINGINNGIVAAKQAAVGQGAAAAQWFWSMLQRNQMPARLLRKEDVDLISFIKKFSDDYADGNFINASPACVAELAQFMLANAILKFCDHKNFFITAVTALTAQAKRPRDPSSVLPWIDQTVKSGSDLDKYARDVLETVDSRPKAWTCAFSSTNLVRHAMSAKPLVVLGLSVSKYQGISGSVRVFQAGNWGTVMGGKNVCALMNFDRTRRYVLTCPRVGFVAQRTGGYSTGTIKEKTLADTAKAILEEGGAAPHAEIFLAALKTMGARVKDLDEDDWLSITEDGFVASALCEMNRAAAATPSGWTLEAAEAAARDAAERAEQTCAENGEATFDFGACGNGSNGPVVQGNGGVVAVGSVANDTVSGGLFYDESVENGVDLPHGVKRPLSDPLFDMEIAPPLEKKIALTVDML